MTLSEGCSWPPIIEDEKVTLNHLVGKLGLGRLGCTVFILTGVVSNLK